MCASDSCIGNFPRFPYNNHINKSLHIITMWFLYPALKGYPTNPAKNWHASSRTGSPKQQKIAINKALEQKLIGPLKESHTEEQSPKAVL